MIYAQYKQTERLSKIWVLNHYFTLFNANEDFTLQGPRISGVEKIFYFLEPQENIETFSVNIK